MVLRLPRLPERAFSKIIGYKHLLVHSFYWYTLAQFCTIWRARSRRTHAWAAAGAMTRYTARTLLDCRFSKIVLCAPQI